MAERILRDFTSSDKFDAFAPTAEALFFRLFPKVDDYGRFNAEPSVVRSACWPRRRDIADEQVTTLLQELAMVHPPAKTALIELYEVHGRAYLAIRNFRQRYRNSAPKFPPPAGKDLKYLPEDPDWKKELGIRAGMDAEHPVHPSAPQRSGTVTAAAAKRLCAELAQNAPQARWQNQGWHWDNCKVPLAVAQPGTSLEPHLKPFLGRVTEAQVMETWAEAVQRTHAAIQRRSDKAKANPGGYVVKTWRGLLEDAVK